MNINCIEYPKTNSKYYRITHPSGVAIYYYHMPGKSKSSAMIATKFGSINQKFKKYGEQEWMEVPDGIAHFLEHKLFEGEQGNAFDYYAKTGAKANAFTSNDRTAYYFTTADNFYESLEILLKFIKHPYFTYDNVEKEKGIIAQEIRMYDDEPSWQGYISLVQSLYSVNPVRVDIAGTVESISKITDKMLYDCYKVFYNNGNLMLCIAGDLSLDKIIEICDQQLPVEVSEEICQSFPIEPKEIYRDYSEREMDVSEEQYFIGIKDNEIAFGDIWKREVAIEILLSALFKKSSTLYKELYENGMINSEFSVDYESGEGFGFVIISGEGEYYKQVASRIKALCDSFSEDMVTESDFKRIRNSLYGKMMRSLDYAENVTYQFVSNRLAGGDIFSLFRAISEIKLQDVIEVGHQILKAENLATSVILPKGKQG